MSGSPERDAFRGFFFMQEKSAGPSWPRSHFARLAESARRPKQTTSSDDIRTPIPRYNILGRRCLLPHVDNRIGFKFIPTGFAAAAASIAIGFAFRRKRNRAFHAQEVKPGSQKAPGQTVWEPFLYELDI